MARRPSSDTSEKAGFPGIKHWLMAAVVMLLLMSGLPFLGRLL